MQRESTVSTQTQQSPTCRRCIYYQRVLARFTCLHFQPVIDHLQPFINSLQQLTALVKATQQPQQWLALNHLPEPQDSMESPKSLSDQDMSLKKPQPNKAAYYYDLKSEQLPLMKCVFEDNLTEIEKGNNEHPFLNSQSYGIQSFIKNFHEPQVNQPFKFDFQPRYPPYLQQFSYLGNKITKTQESQTLRRILAKRPLLKDITQQVGIKVIKTLKRHIYLGLVSQEQSKKAVTVRPRNNSVISYLIQGGRHLYVLNKNENEKMPHISDGDTIKFTVNIEKRRMEWFKNEQKFCTLESIDFGDQPWLPFVVLKDKGDTVELI